MKAASFTGKKNVMVTEIEKPVRKPGEVMVKVKACGVCGSERKQWEKGTEYIPGHEIAGVVEEVDKNSKIETGSRVALYLPYYCGECFYCQQGKTNLCINIKGLLGHGINGGYAEYISVDERHLIFLDDRLSFEEGVLLLDTIGTTFHGLRLGQAKNHDIALVIGCGPIGLGAIFGLRAMGVDKIYAADLVTARLEYAKKLGAIALKVKKKNLSDIISGNQATGIPLVIDCVGSPETIKEAVEVVTPGGQVVLIGEYWDDWTVHPTSNYMLKDWNLTRSWYFPLNEVAQNMEILKCNFKVAEKLISHSFSLDKLDEAFKLFFSGNSAKIMIKP